jgi:hypothetical protein
MKKSIAFAAAASLVFSGCLLTSFNPFYKEENLEANNLLPGEWINKNSLLTFSQLEKGYLLNYKDCKDPYNAPNDYSTCTMADFTVHLMKLGGNYYMDFYPRNFVNSDNLFLNLHIRPTHSLAKVKIEKDQLEFRLVSFNWTTGYIENKKGKLSHMKIDDIITLTGTTDELQSFILKNQNEPGFFDDPIVVKRK